MASRFFRVLALHGRARPLLHCALCHRPLLRLPLTLTHSWRPAALSHSGQQWNLHELVSQGRYSEAIDMWEKAKEEGVADPSLYSAVMRLAAKLGRGEATRSIKADMDKQGWSMDHDCSLHYLQPLVNEGQLSEVMDFIKTSQLKEDPAFLTDVASLLLESGHAQAALEVCNLIPLSSPPPPHTLPLLLVRLEAMGSVGMVKEMEDLVTMLYPAEGGECRVPREVELTLATGLSLAGQPTRALDYLKKMRVRSVPSKVVAVLMESAQKEQNYTIAAEVFSLLWNKSMQKPTDEAILLSPSSLPRHASHHLRAVTAAIYLQAFAHRDVQDTGFHASGNLTRLLEKNFYQELKDNSYTPSPRVYQPLLLLGCYNSRAVGWADQAIKHCAAIGEGVPAEDFTGWTQYCGTLNPQQALKVIQLVRVHRHHYNVDLTLDHYADLLSIRYRCDDLTQEKEALDCIRAIKNSMGVRSMLRSTKAYNHLLHAVTHIPVVGAHYTTYNDMLADEVSPDLKTFHLLLDGSLMEGSVKSTKRAAYFLWRSLMKEWPRVKPDIDLMNKFIQCCLVCMDHDRAFVFLSALSDCGADPNIETFTLLLKVCHSVKDYKGFNNVLTLAHHCLPDQRADISALAHEMQLEWRAEEDYSLAKDILSQLDTPKI